MASVKEIYDFLDSKYPYVVQEDYDNSGIMVDCGRDVDRIVIALDITTSVVKYAADVGAQLILSHHPIIFRPVKSIQFGTPLQQLAASGISAVSAHTNLDISDGGVNDALASRLALHDVRPVFHVSDSVVGGVPRENYIGRAGNLAKEMQPAEFAAFVAKALNGRHSAEFVDGGRKIRRVAVGGGACGEFVFECAGLGIDAFVTGEAKHHELIYAKDNGITMIAAGHYATECVVLEPLAAAVREGFPGIEVLITDVDRPTTFTE